MALHWETIDAGVRAAFVRKMREVGKKRWESLSQAEKELQMSRLQHPRKLSDQDVREIRASTMGPHKLALVFGVGDTTIEHIKLNLRYKDVE